MNIKRKKQGKKNRTPNQNSEKFSTGIECTSNWNSRKSRKRNWGRGNI